MEDYDAREANATSDSIPRSSTPKPLPDLGREHSRASFRSAPSPLRRISLPLDAARRTAPFSEHCAVIGELHFSSPSPSPSPSRPSSPRPGLGLGRALRSDSPVIPAPIRPASPLVRSLSQRSPTTPLRPPPPPPIPAAPLYSSEDISFGPTQPLHIRRSCSLSSSINSERRATRIPVPPPPTPAVAPAHNPAPAPAPASDAPPPAGPAAVQVVRDSLARLVSTMDDDDLRTELSALVAAMTRRRDVVRETARLQALADALARELAHMGDEQWESALRPMRRFSGPVSAKAAPAEQAPGRESGGSYSTDETAVDKDVVHMNTGTGTGTGRDRTPPAADDRHSVQSALEQVANWKPGWHEACPAADNLREKPADESEDKGASNMGGKDTLKESKEKGSRALRLFATLLSGARGGGSGGASDDVPRADWPTVGRKIRDTDGKIKHELTYTTITTRSTSPFPGFPLPHRYPAPQAPREESSSGSGSLAARRRGTSLSLSLLAPRPDLARYTAVTAGTAAGAAEPPSPTGTFGTFGVAAALKLVPSSRAGTPTVVPDEKERRKGWLGEKKLTRLFEREKEREREKKGKSIDRAPAASTSPAHARTVSGPVAHPLRMAEVSVWEDSDSE